MANMVISIVQLLVLFHKNICHHSPRNLSNHFLGFCFDMMDTVIFCRLYVPFLFEIWELTGVWELNGLSHAFWIMIHAPTMEIGPMEQVIFIQL